jgi:acetoacetate decarboxylase
MNATEVRERAFAMPLTQPAYPPGPYRFYDREYLIITYRTDREKLRELVPEPLEIISDLVKFEFIRMPNSTGFGDYTEAGQVIPVSFRGRTGSYTLCMFLNDHPPIAGGRELWGFPKKLAGPSLRTETDTLVGTLDYGPIRVATGTMGFKHKEADTAATGEELAAPNFLLKIIPHVDGSARICELVEYHLEDVQVKGVWTGPGALSLNAHALAPVAELPVLEVVSTIHLVADLTLGLGKVVHDYLAETSGREGRSSLQHANDLDSDPLQMLFASSGTCPNQVPGLGVAEVPMSAMGRTGFRDS